MCKKRMWEGGLLRLGRSRVIDQKGGVGGVWGSGPGVVKYRAQLLDEKRRGWAPDRNRRMGSCAALGGR